MKSWDPGHHFCSVADPSGGPCIQLTYLGSLRLYLVNFVDMWNLKACLKKALRIIPSEIEFESNFSSISQYLKSTEYSTFLIVKKFEIIYPLKLNVRVISTVYQNILMATAFLIIGNFWGLDIWEWIWESFQQRAAQENGARANGSEYINRNNKVAIFTHL